MITKLLWKPKMKKSTVRMVDKIQIRRNKGYVIFTFHGTGFLQNMIRILVGTLLEVGNGKKEPEEMPAILEACDPAGGGLYRSGKGTVPDSGGLLVRAFGFYKEAFHGCV